MFVIEEKENAKELKKTSMNGHNSNKILEKLQEMNYTRRSFILKDTQI